MGIKYPTDLEAWRSWEEKQNLLRYIKTKVKKDAPQPEENFLLAVREPKSNPLVLIALEATTPTQIAALLKPGLALEKQGHEIAVLSLEGSSEYLKNLGFTQQIKINSSANPDFSWGSSITEVIAAGHYLSVGSKSYKIAKKFGWSFNVVQHGLNTPYAPPLPENSMLFSFSEKDAEFWISGRTDIAYEVVGSQLFYEAAQQPAITQGQEIDMSALTFLGQMHGAELPRASFAKSSYDFCKKHSATYRPHPSEKDKISLFTHKLWAKQGIKIDTSGTPLNQSTAPVVSIFSTGVLEAAIRGVPAWVYHSNPPAWLKEFWERYGMKQWGSEPTPAPAQPDIEPALAIANYIAHRLEK